MRHYRHSGLLFALRNLKGFLYLLFSSQRNAPRRIAVLERLIEKCRSRRNLQPMADFLIETYGNALFEKLGVPAPSAKAVVENADGYNRALEAYLSVLDRDSDIKTSSFCKVSHRAAICCCRLGMFRNAGKLLDTAIQRGVSDHEEQELMKVRVACSRLQELSPDQNLWQYLSELQKRNITKEESEYLGLLRRAMNEIRGVDG